MESSMVAGRNGFLLRSLVTNLRPYAIPWNRHSSSADVDVEYIGNSSWNFYHNENLHTAADDRSFRSLEGLPYPIGGERCFSQSDANSIIDCVGYRWQRAIDAYFAYTLGTVWSRRFV